MNHLKLRSTKCVVDCGRRSKIPVTQSLALPPHTHKLKNNQSGANIPFEKDFHIYWKFASFPVILWCMHGEFPNELIFYEYVCDQRHIWIRQKMYFLYFFQKQINLERLLLISYSVQTSTSCFIFPNLMRSFNQPRSCWQTFQSKKTVVHLSVRKTFEITFPVLPIRSSSRTKVLMRTTFWPTSPHLFLFGWNFFFYMSGRTFVNIFSMNAIFWSQMGH